MSALPLTILLVLLAYLLGSLPFAVIVSKLYGLEDPRSHGSGNPGATNVLRTGNKSAALLTLFGDAAKGWLAVWLAGRLGGDTLTVAIAGVAAFLGHVYPVFLKFRGGKGVATALGIMLALDPWLGLAVFATWLGVFAISRISSLSALLAALLAPVYGAYFMGGGVTIVTLSLLSALLIWRHRANIRRLLSGEEGRFAKPKH